MTSPVRDARMLAGLLVRVDSLRREIDGIAADFEQVREITRTLVASIEAHIVGATRRLRLLKEFLEGSDGSAGQAGSPPPT